MKEECTTVIECPYHLGQFVDLPLDFDDEDLQGDVIVVQKIDGPHFRIGTELNIVLCWDIFGRKLLPNSKLDSKTVSFETGDGIEITDANGVKLPIPFRPLWDELIAILTKRFLGEKIPVNIVDREDGSIIISANKRISLSELRRLARCAIEGYEYVQMDSFPAYDEILEILKPFVNKFKEIKNFWKRVNIGE